MFQKKELITLYNENELHELISALQMSKIDCKYSLHTHNNQWGVRGSRRGIFGSFFDKCDTQYTIYVSKKDFLSASKILEKRKMVE